MLSMDTLDTASDPVFATPVLTGRPIYTGSVAVPSTERGRTAGIYAAAKSLRALLGLPEVRKATDRMCNEVRARGLESRMSIAIGREHVAGAWCSEAAYGSIVEAARASLYVELCKRVIAVRDRIEGGDLAMCPVSLPGMAVCA